MSTRLKVLRRATGDAGPPGDEIGPTLGKVEPKSKRSRGRVESNKSTPPTKKRKKDKSTKKDEATATVTARSRRELTDADLWDVDPRDSMFVMLKLYGDNGTVMPETIANLKLLRRRRGEETTPEDIEKIVARSRQRYENDKTASPFSYKPGMEEFKANEQVENREISESSDLHNTLLLCYRYWHEMRYCPGIGWLIFDGTVWRQDQLGAEMRAQTLPRLILWRASDIADFAANADSESTREIYTKKADALLKWSKTSGTAQRIKAALDLMRTHCRIEPDELDQHPLLLNCMNGTIDLESGNLLEHDRRQYLTKICPTEFNDYSKAPLWESLVSWAMKDRTDLIGYFQRSIGYSATGSVKEQVINMAIGDGDNAKSSILETIRSVLGPDYVRIAMADVLMASQGERHSTEVAHLRGARMIYCTETESGRRLATSRMKMLTGETSITARGMHQDPFTFQMQGTIWLQSNHRPEISDQGHALWRRIRVIPFDNKISEEQKDRDLPEKLMKEREGILRWIVEGAVAWSKHGLGMAPEVVAAVAAYRAESDSLSSFISEMCTTEQKIGLLNGAGQRVGLKAPAGELFDAYEAWCRSTGAHPFDARKFKVAMVGKGFNHHKLNSGVVYLGLQLLPTGMDHTGTTPSRSGR